MTRGKGQHGNIFCPVFLLEHTDCWTEKLLLSDTMLGYRFNYSATTRIVFHLERRGQERRELYSYGTLLLLTVTAESISLSHLLIYVGVTTQNYLIISLYLILFTPREETGRAPLFSYFSFPLVISEIFSITCGLSE